MAPKRGSTASPASRTPKSAKASPATPAASTGRSSAKRATPAQQAATEDVEPKGEPTPLELLVEALGGLPLPEPCLEMLRASAPHCLDIAPSERHRYQAELAREITGLFAHEEAGKQSVVTDLESEAAALRTEDDEVMAKTTAARGVVDTTTAAKAEAAATRATLREAADAAKAALVTARAHAEGHAGEVTELHSKRASLEALLAECWTPAVDSAWPGKNWRKRDKAIAEIVEYLKQANAPESLLDSAAAALKTKASSRGRFAAQALIHSKKALDGQVEEVVKKIDGSKAEEELRVQAVRDAESAFEAAEARHTEAQQAVEAAEKAQAAAEAEVRVLEDSQKDVAGRFLKLNVKLDEAKAALTQAAELTAAAKRLEAASDVAPAAGQQQ